MGPVGLRKPPVLPTEWTALVGRHRGAGQAAALPPLLPSLAAAAAALRLVRRTAPHTAFVGGTLGTLIGADLLNFSRLQDLGAPVASIGGRGPSTGSS